MNLNSDVKELLESFNAFQVKYLVVGGYAYAFHVEPPYTKDLDVWVRADTENAALVYQALKAFGAPLDGLTPQDFAVEHYFYRMGSEPNAIDVMMSVSGLTFDAAWNDRVEFDYHGVTVQIIAKADLITAKLAAGRPQDLVDAHKLKETLKWKHLPKLPINPQKPRKKSTKRSRRPRPSQTRSR